MISIWVVPLSLSGGQRSRRRRRPIHESAKEEVEEKDEEEEEKLEVKEEDKEEEIAEAVPSVLNVTSVDHHNQEACRWVGRNL